MKIFKLICIFLFLSFNLGAFEVKEFKGGMSFNELVAKANSKSWYVKPMADIQDAYDIKNSKDITELSVSFCETSQKLHWLSYTGDAESFHIFPKLILNYESQNFRIHDTSVRSIIHDGLESNSIKIIMKNKSKKYEIGLNLYSTDKYGVSNYQIIHSYPNKDSFCND